MASFKSDKFENLFAPNLQKAEKDRLRTSLKQFKKEEKSIEINYAHFFLDSPTTHHFLQGDLLLEIRNADWNFEKKEYEKKYPAAILLSNTCDCYGENHGDVPKEVLFAPAIEFAGYLSYLLEKGLPNERVKEIEREMKSQSYSNIFYIPPTFSNNRDYLIFFDKIFWFPKEELQTYLSDINSNRICSLYYFGHYLLLIKLSYYLCRLPEEDDRGKAEKKEVDNVFLKKIKLFFKKFNPNAK